MGVVGGLMWQVGIRLPNGKIHGLSGSGDRRSFAVGYYDSLQQRLDKDDWLLLCGGEPVDRSKVKIPTVTPARTYKVEIFGPGYEWSLEVTGGKEYCHGYFYGVVDPLPSPAVRILDPKGEIYDERDAVGAPSPV